MSTEFENLKKWIEATRDEPMEEMDCFFEARLGDYEEHMVMWKDLYEWMGRLIPQSTETLLDLGCGTGLELDQIFLHCPEIKVTGVDLSVGMLGKLKEKHGDKKLNLIQGDYFEVDFGEECFDVAVSFETLHHFKAERKIQVFEKICRALKPGGFYLEADYVADDDEWEEFLFQESALRREKWGIPEDTWVHFDTPLTLEHEMELMRKAGFSQVEVLGWSEDETPMIRAVK